MTPEELEAIRRRIAGRYPESYEDTGFFDAMDDAKALLAEVERLQQAPTHLAPEDRKGLATTLLALGVLGISDFPDREERIRDAILIVVDRLGIRAEMNAVAREAEATLPSAPPTEPCG